MGDKRALGDAKKGELSMNQRNLKQMEKSQQEVELRGEKQDSDEAEEEEEIGFLVMADCIQYDGKVDSAQTKVCWSKTSGSSKKAVSKLIKSVIDIDDDESNSRNQLQNQEDLNLPVVIKTVRVKKVVRMTGSKSSKKAKPLVSNIKKEKEVEPPLGKFTGSGNQARRKDLGNLTTVTLGIKRCEVSGLIGHQGKNIRELEQKTGARIVVRDGIGEMRTVEIRGNIASVAKAKSEVERYMRNLTTITLNIKWCEAHRLIGHQGKNIRELEQKTGARIAVNDQIGEMRTVEIYGNIESVAKAKSEVEKYCYSHCRTKVKVSKRVASALYLDKGKIWSDVKADCKVFMKGRKEGSDDIIYVFGSEEGEREAKSRLEEFANSMTVPHWRGKAFVKK